MYINNNDLDFLMDLLKKLGNLEGGSDDVKRLWNLIVKLLEQRDAGNKKTREAIAEKRKTDKNYARRYTEKDGGESNA